MRWLDLNGALAYITSTYKCTSVEAQRYLKAAIGAGTVPVKWSDSDGASDIPDSGYLKGSKLNLSETGFAHDKRAYRPLMVLHSALQTARQNKILKSNFDLSKEFGDTAPGLLSDWDENDGSRWMTLVSAEEHIEVLQDCDSLDALRQLKEEIGGGLVRVRWADDPVGKPDVAALKASQFILLGSGLAPDGAELRPLLLNSEDILRLWPKERDGENTPVQPPNANSRPGRKSARETIRKTLSEMQSDGSLKTSNQSEIARKVMRLNNIRENQSGWSMRTVLQHISVWLDEHTPDDAKMRK
jgi:hypothetical protein